MKTDIVFLGMALSIGLIPLQSAAQYYTIPADQIDPATGNCYVVVRGGQESCRQYPGQAPMTNGMPITPLSPPPASIPNGCANAAVAAPALQQENQDYAAANTSYEATEAANNALDAKVAACVNSGKDGCGVAYNHPGGAAYAAYSSAGQALAWACMSSAQQTAQANMRAEGECQRYSSGGQGNGSFGGGNGPFGGGGGSASSSKYTDCLSKKTAAYIAAQNANMANPGATQTASGGSAASGSSVGAKGTAGSAIGVQETWGSAAPSAAGSSAGSAPKNGPVQSDATSASSAAAGPSKSGAVAASAPGGSDPCAQAAAMRSESSLSENLSGDGASMMAFALSQLDAACRAVKESR